MRTWPSQSSVMNEARIDAFAEHVGALMRLAFGDACPVAHARAAERIHGELARRRGSQ